MHMYMYICIMYMCTYVLCIYICMYNISNLKYSDYVYFSSLSLHVSFCSNSVTV